MRVVLRRGPGSCCRPSGGALAKMLPFFKLGIGGPVAGGRQYVPWIHLDDVVGALLVRGRRRGRVRSDQRHRAESGDQRAALDRARAGCCTARRCSRSRDSRSSCCTGRWRRWSRPASGLVLPSCRSSVTDSRTRSSRRRSGTCSAASRTRRTRGRSRPQAPAAARASAGRGVRVLRGRAQPRADHPAVAAVRGPHARAGADGGWRADRLPAALSRRAARMDLADRGVGARPPVRRSAAARAVRPVAPPPHVRRGSATGR